MNETILKFEDVYYAYEGDEGETLPNAVDGVSFEINKGEFVAILGHNGSGKSTVAKLTNAMLVPQKGKIFVKEYDTSVEDNELKIRTTVGIVMQNPDNQIVATIVEEDVAFGPENLGVPQKELRTRVDNALKLVGMYEYKDYEPHKLSGGQKQRIAIAGVIAMQTECIVFDEPTAMLDPKGRKEVLAAIHDLRQKGYTIVLITHFMEEAVDADKIIVMNDGKIILTGTPKEVFTQSDLLYECDLAVPQVTLLSKAIKNNGINMPDDILTTDEFINAFTANIKQKRKL
ncbi:MAG TPA: energy-coupling factor transporter ATPase [Clostridiales bacterium]|nr:energy-coupling factor transporter ATPase [Clostridiales bacterium]